MDTLTPCDPANPVIDIPVIDRQHAQLIALVTALESELSQPDPNLALVDATMREVREYTRYHFGYEEGLMTQTGCPAAGENQAQHQAFMVKMAELEAQLYSPGIDDRLRFAVGSDMAGFLRRWIGAHICAVDCRLRLFSHLIRSE